MGSSRFFSEVIDNTASADSSSDRLEGTAEYLAPEILRGGGISPASDLWAFAVVLFQMLAGRTPMVEEEPVKRKGGKKSTSDSGSNTNTNLTQSERDAQRAKDMAAHNEEQKQELLRKMVAFEQQQTDFPETFDQQARDLIERIMKSDPSQRLGVHTVDHPMAASLYQSNDLGGVRWLIDWSAIKSHPFFNGIAWDTLHTLPAPSLGGGSVAPAPDAIWSRRKNSIMWAPMPKVFSFSEGSGILEPIREERQKEVHTTTSLGGASGSLRAQLFANKSTAGGMAGGISGQPPRFGALVEMPGEGDEDEENEDDEDDNEDDDDDDDADSMDLSNSMASAPFPVSSSSSSAPRVRQPSSRASGPMAYVEPSKETEEQTTTVTALPLRPAIRSSIGMRSNLPPPHGSSSGALPPHSSGALPPKPSTIFSSVPRADATAGPTGLGMGMRKMGGNSTASALLSRIMNKPTMSPMAELPNSMPPPHPSKPQ